MDHSPFSRLPAELRNYIWSLSLQHGTSRLQDPHQLSPNIYLEPSLGQTCRQIREEALLMFYACQSSMAISIVNSDTSPVRAWLTTHQERARLIKQLDIVSKTAVKHELDEGTESRRAWELLVEALRPYSCSGLKLFWYKKFMGGREWMPKIQETLFQSSMRRMIEERMPDPKEMDDHLTENR